MSYSTVSIHRLSFCPTAYPTTPTTKVEVCISNHGPIRPQANCLANSGTAELLLCRHGSCARSFQVIYQTCNWFRSMLVRGYRWWLTIPCTTDLFDFASPGLSLALMSEHSWYFRLRQCHYQRRWAGRWFGVISLQPSQGKSGRELCLLFPMSKLHFQFCTPYCT